MTRRLIQFDHILYESEIKKNNNKTTKKIKFSP